MAAVTIQFTRAARRRASTYIDYGLLPGRKNAHVNNSDYHRSPITLGEIYTFFYIQDTGNVKSYVFTFD